MSLFLQSIIRNIRKQYIHVQPIISLRQQPLIQKQQTANHIPCRFTTGGINPKKLSIENDFPKMDEATIEERKEKTYIFKRVVTKRFMVTRENFDKCFEDYNLTNEEKEQIWLRLPEILNVEQIEDASKDFLECSLGEDGYYEDAGESIDEWITENMYHIYYKYFDNDDDEEE